MAGVMTLFVALFLAGILTVLLPCILPLLPIVLGVSVSGRNPWRPLLMILGMVVSFVAFTFLLLVVLREFVEAADYIRLGTYYILFLFGTAFLTSHRTLQILGAVLGGFFFYDKGWMTMTIAQAIGATAMELGSKMAAKIQGAGATIQSSARGHFGTDAPLTAFIIGMTLGLVWVPCAGPALGFAFALVRDESGIRAASALAAYALGTAVPLLAVGYGGQWAVHSVRSLSQYTGRIKQGAGVLLILTALGLYFHFFDRLQILLIEKTNFGNLGTRIEERLFEEDMFETMKDTEDTEDTNDTEETKNQKPNTPSDPAIGRAGNNQVSSVRTMNLPKLPKLIRASEFAGLGPWHNSEPFTLASQKGKVVLVDFWTYSCINCIRTLPHIQGYWERYGKLAPHRTSEASPGAGFVLIGVHSPEFVFEKSEKNVADAIRRHGLTYPVAQDNDFATWKAFANRYWPAKYLIDAEGYIRYTHFGEGAYEETDLAIQSLLAEVDESLVTGLSSTSDSATSDERSGRMDLTPETYMGARSWQAFGNGTTFPTDDIVTYKAPEEMELHSYYLDGQWQLVDDERQVLRSAEGEIRMKFLGGEINLVIGTEGMEGKERMGGDRAKTGSHVAVEVDGNFVKEFDVNRYDLYNLFTGDYGEHEIILHITGKGLAGYAFTFGS